MSKESDKQEIIVEGVEFCHDSEYPYQQGLYLEYLGDELEALYAKNPDVKLRLVVTVMTDEEESMKTQGKRHDLEEDEYNLEPGEYGKSPDGWFFSPPTTENIGIGGLGKHDIVEHEDDTITVSPSILFNSHKGTWHGYLEHGVWREV